MQIKDRSYHKQNAAHLDRKKENETRGTWCGKVSPERVNGHYTMQFSMAVYACKGASLYAE